MIDMQSSELEHDIMYKLQNGERRVHTFSKPKLNSRLMLDLRFIVYVLRCSVLYMHAEKSKYVSNTSHFLY